MLGPAMLKQLQFQSGARLAHARNRRTPSIAANSFAAKLACAILIGLFQALSITAPKVAAAANFSQSNQAVTPSPADAHRLAQSFTPPYPPGPMPPQVNQILLRSAPSDLRSACAAMVDSWGAFARGSSRITVRILGIADGNAWLAYRCDSRLPQFAGNYSERLAAFNASRGIIQFLDLAAPEDTRATLYHVGLATTLKLVQAENSAAFEVFAVEPGPLAATAVRASENRYVIVANSPSATKVALSLVTARTRPGSISRDPALGDSSQYRAQPRFDHDIDGHLTFVTVYHRDSTLAATPHFGLTRYAWDAAILTFVSVKPRPLQPVKPRRLPPVPPDGQLAH